MNFVVKNTYFYQISSKIFPVCINDVYGLYHRKIVPTGCRLTRGVVQFNSDHSKRNKYYCEKYFILQTYILTETSISRELKLKFYNSTPNYKLYFSNLNYLHAIKVYTEKLYTERNLHSNCN